MNKPEHAVECSTAVEADWSYGATGEGPAGLPLALSVYADRPHVRATLCEDAGAAGLRVSVAADLTALIAGEARPLGDVVLVDCPVVDPAAMAALARLDLRAARTGARLIVSTSVAALDDVFGCLDQSQVQILVDPDRSERVIALGHVLAQFPAARLRELSEDERHLLMRLTEQVGRLPDGSSGFRQGATRPTRPSRRPRTDRRLFLQHRHHLVRPRAGRPNLAPRAPCAHLCPMPG